MFIRSISFAAAAAAIFFAGAAPAALAADAGATVAVLAAPFAQPVKVVIDGRTWKCDTVNCTAAASDFASGAPFLANAAARPRN